MVRGPTPAEQLLDFWGPVDRYHDHEEIGDLGVPSRKTLEEILDPVAEAGEQTRLGPLDKVHMFWFSGMACDGCKIAVLGADTPSLEALMMNSHPGLPRIVLHTEPLLMASGPNYWISQEQALKGELEDPYVIVLEGSATDELKAAATGGYFAGQGEMPWGPDGELRNVTCEEWIARLAPGAAAAFAIGTCATWGGIPSATGNPTGAMSLMDFLGDDYRSTLGLPVINVPGCAPIGDNFTEAVASVLYYVQGFGPMPEMDELGRPSWQWGETVHRHCVRGAYYEEGTFAKNFGDPDCLVEIGCWGPVVNCNITSRGAYHHVGGCMNSGGACIGCTMPGFPDKFTPFYKMPPGSSVSSMASRLLGAFIRPLRRLTNEDLDREVRWDVHHHIPSGWAPHKREPGWHREALHKGYNLVRRRSDRAKTDADEWGKRHEFTARKEPADEARVFSVQEGASGPDGE